ncbi:MAG: hypothetical protein ACI4LO_00265 [Anaerovoracaceae bacterium]
MTKLEYLEQQREREYHNFMCYSGNISMTIARPGFEKEWELAKAKCRVVEELIAEAEGKSDATVYGAAVINGKVHHNWQKVIAAAERIVDIKW